MIVGLCGLARSGKDTAAAHLVTHHGYRRIAFADALRNALYALDPFVATPGGTYALTALVDAKGWENAKAYPDVRRLLQRLGTEVGRTQWGADVWVDLALRGVTPGQNVVVTDVRFPNEADAIKRLGGIVVEIRRPGAGLTGTTATHTSEHMAFDTDITLVNDGTVTDLEAMIGRLAEPQLDADRISRPG